jgi:hypothetical protein
MSSVKQADGWEADVARNTVVLGCWTGAWVATMALAAFGPTSLWNGNRA